MNIKKKLHAKETVLETLCGIVEAVIQEQPRELELRIRRLRKEAERLEGKINALHEERTTKAREMDELLRGLNVQLSEAFRKTWDRSINTLRAARVEREEICEEMVK